MINDINRSDFSKYGDALKELLKQVFNGTVIYLGMFFHIWAHCLTDNLKRVWFLKSEVYKNLV